MNAGTGTASISTSTVRTLTCACRRWCAVQLDVLVNFGLLSLLVWEYVCRLTGTGPADAFNLRQLGIRVEYVVPAAFAGECVKEGWKHPFSKAVKTAGTGQEWWLLAAGMKSKMQTGNSGHCCRLHCKSTSDSLCGMCWLRPIAMTMTSCKAATRHAPQPTFRPPSPGYEAGQSHAASSCCCAATGVRGMSAALQCWCGRARWG
jgi:hypothetical protein